MLKDYIGSEILPRYDAFDAAHRRDHVDYVISCSLELAKHYGLDMDMVYVIAAYHDLGLEGPRAIHHITSGKILTSDVRLRKWFSPEQIKIMREAVEDHRASSSHAPRSIYGKIVAEADRDINPETVFRRTVQFGLSHYPEKTREEHWERFVDHMSNKYSRHGYIKLWIQNSPNQEGLKLIRDIIGDKQKLREEFDKYYNIETSQL